MSKSILNSMSGNTFATKTFSVNPSSRVWRTIRYALPGGGTINADALTKVKAQATPIIPAGTPAILSNKVVTPFFAYSTSATYKVGEGVFNSGAFYVCKTAITEGEAFTSSKWTAISVIDGLTQDDVVVDSDTSVASATVIYSGEVYGYAYDSATLTAIKAKKPAEIHVVE